MGDIQFCNQCGIANAPGAQFCSSCGTPMNMAAAGIPASAAEFPPSSIAVILGIGGLAASRVTHAGLVPAMMGFMVLRLFMTGVNWLYEALMESSSHQATLGKMIFGLKVTDLEGNRISFARATGRHFAKYASAMILGIGFIMAGFTERKQALHDMLAGTLVRWSS